jgi:O-antigen/teichoic acid export membrane protein
MRAVRRVAINTAVQYIQLLLNVLIGLYSVRLILAALGDVDYGIYDLIAGIIALLGFISSSLSQTSIRFISVSLGTSDSLEVKRVFRSCFWMHFIIAVCLVCIMELVGLFIFNGYLNIPNERIVTAERVYQFMILTVFLNIIVTPFKALLIAHERLVLISIVGILDSLFKLGIALLLALTIGDKLLIYGALMAGITVINFIVFCLSSLFMYSGFTSFGIPKRKDIIQVSSFASWTLLDVLGSLVNRQGYAIMLNKFFGPSANTIFALARQIEGHLYTVSSSVVDSIKPQIMKSQGAGDLLRVFRISLTAGKLGFSMMSLVAIPLLVMMPDVLDLWLEHVPEGTALFSRLLIVACMIGQLTLGLVYANQAVGNIKWFSIVISSVRILALPVSILVLLTGAPAYAAIIVFVVFETIGTLSRVFILSRISSFNPKHFLSEVLFSILPPSVISFVVCGLCYKCINGYWGMIVACVASAFVYLFVLFFCGLSPLEREALWNVIRKNKTNN